MEIILEAEGVYLRNLQPEDGSRIYAYRKAPDCARYQRWEDTSDEAVKAFVERFQNSSFLSKQEEQHYAVCVGTELVGDLSYFYTQADRCITLGITIAPEHQRKGYGRKILSAVIAAVRERHPELDIVALIDPENRASIALFERLGFVLECYAEKIRSCIYTIYGEQ